MRTSGSRQLLIVSNLYPPHIIGGAEVVAHRQALQLRDRGHRVSVFAGWISPPEEVGRLTVEEVDGLRIYRTPVASFHPNDNFHDPAIATRFQAVLRAEQPDVVHFHNLAGLGFSLIPIAHRLGLPSVVTLHDHAGYCFRATALREDGTICDDAEGCAITCLGAVQPRDAGRALPMRLRRDYVSWALGHADRLVSPSVYLADAYRTANAVDPARLTVISNGIDLAPFDGIGPRSADDRAGKIVRFFCAAYLGIHKGILELLQAAALLTAEPDLAGRWALAIAGDGFLRPQVEAEISQDKFGHAVTYLGRVPRSRIIEELAAADVVVLPSLWPENEPVILLEAIAAGRAQLATDIGGIPQLVQAGVTGELVPPADAAALAAAMAAYIRSPERAHRQGEASRTRCSSVSESTTIDALEGIYAGLANSPLSFGPRDPLILCAGDWPLPEVAEICNQLYQLESSECRIRLVWHGWIESEAWQYAALLWNWSSGADHVAIQRALRSGVSILAPADCTMAVGLEASFGAAVTYDTFQEGKMALAHVSRENQALKKICRRTRLAADLIAASAPAIRYHLPTPSIII
ncbi:hypothetical protein ACOSOMT5_P2932 [Acidiphilium sp. MT5]